MELYIPDDEFALITIGDKKIAILGPTMSLGTSKKAESIDILLVTNDQFKNYSDVISCYLATGTKIIKY